MDAELYISQQAPERQGILTSIHRLILENDKTIKVVIEPIMGKEMILYKADKLMKYGLSSVKNYMSLHVLPMYASKELHERYRTLLSEANFQKGCINFTDKSQMPLSVLRELIKDCSQINLARIKEELWKTKKEKAKNQI
jgi:hypothetical protein